MYTSEKSITVFPFYLYSPKNLKINKNMVPRIGARIGKYIPIIIYSTRVYFFQRNDATSSIFSHDPQHNAHITRSTHKRYCISLTTHTMHKDKNTQHTRHTLDTQGRAHNTQYTHNAKYAPRPIQVVIPFEFCFLFYPPPGIASDT